MRDTFIEWSRVCSIRTVCLYWIRIFIAHCQPFKSLDISTFIDIPLFHHERRLHIEIWHSQWQEALQSLRMRQKMHLVTLNIHHCHVEFAKKREKKVPWKCRSFEPHWIWGAQNYRCLTTRSAKGFKQRHKGGLTMQMLNNAKWNITTEIECQQLHIEFPIMCPWEMHRKCSMPHRIHFAWVVLVQIDAIHWHVSHLFIEPFVFQVQKIINQFERQLNRFMLFKCSCQLTASHVHSFA